MAMFGGSRNAEAQSAPPPAPKGAPAAGGLSVIGAGMTVRGDIESNGVVKIEGAVEGQLNARNQVLVARGGDVTGNIDTREAIIGGAVHGSISASERVEIQSGATVEGDITTQRIAVAEGAKVDGVIRMSGAALEARAQARPDSGEGRGSGGSQAYTRPSVPVARVAVPPRTTSGTGT